MRTTLLALLLSGCIVDDWNGQPYMGPPSSTGVPGGLPTGAGDTGTIPVANGLEGVWISQGADLSDLLAAEPFNYVRVDAIFRPSGDYEVTGEDADGTLYPLLGTWTATEGTPGTITLDQDDPYVAVAEGLWQIDGNALTYEVVQITPSYGFQPPTPGSGFGSSTGPGLSPGANVQTYRRSP